MPLIFPNTRIEIPSPAIFLAGPIVGAPPWHNEAIAYLLNMKPDVFLASPNRNVRGEYIQHALRSEAQFSSLLDWERHYLEQASKKGCILFWLPVHQQHYCDRVYGRDTRGELGEWRGRLLHDREIRLVIGAEEGFDGLDVIQRNYRAVDPDISFARNLEETCRWAIDKAYSGL